MRILLAMMLAVLLYGCERDAAVDPEGPGAWLTLGRSGVASAFVRFDDGQTEKWVAPFSTRFGSDGRSLEITLQTERCGELQFKSVLGNDNLQLSNQNVTSASARSWPCRLNNNKPPAWKLLTKVVNSKQEQ